MSRDQNLIRGQSRALTLAQVGWDPWTGSFPTYQEVWELIGEEPLRRGGSGDDNLHHAFLAGAVRHYRNHWEFARERARHPSNWDQLALLLKSGEQDERRLLECITLPGAGGEEVLLAIQAIETYEDLEARSLAYYRAAWGSSPERRNWWWSPGGEWLPHLGGPEYARTWGEFRTRVAEGALNAARDTVRYLNSRVNLPRTLQLEWEVEVRHKMVPYVEQAQDLKDRTPWSLNAPLDRADWVQKVKEGDCLFLRAASSAREGARTEAEGAYWEYRHYSLSKVFNQEAAHRARATALSVWAGWAPLRGSGPYSDLHLWLEAPEAFSPEGPKEGLCVPPFRANQSWNLCEGDPVPYLWEDRLPSTNLKDWSPHTEDVRLTVAILRAGGQREWAQEVLKRWG